MSFDLNENFTDNYQIKLMVEDKQKNYAIFVTESYHVNHNSSNDNLIDSVTFMKIVLGADD